MKALSFWFAVLLVGVQVCAPARAGAQDDRRRPNLSQACNAWREHISGLIEQHRLAGEMPEKELFEFVRQFVAARNNCAPGRYETGLRMYEAIQLGRPVTPLK